MGHVRRGFAIAADDRQQRLSFDRVCVEELWSHPRHTDAKIDDIYARYARELDPVKRKAIGREMLEYVADKMYWNVISGSPFYMVAQPWVKNYTYNAEFEVHWGPVWLDR